jgi:acetyl-CoA C-acetyltransferase
VSAYVAGAGAVACRRWYGEKTAHELSLEVIRAALIDAGRAPADVDALYTTQIGWFAPQEKFLAQRMAETLGVRPSAMAEIECGGASALVAFRLAAQDVVAGRVRCALVWASDVEVPTKRFDPAKHLHLIEQARTFYGPYAAAYGVVAVVALYAMAAQVYMSRHALTSSEVAEVAVALRRNAGNNALAYLRDPITRDDVLSSRVVSPPLHFLECAPWADGAAAAVLTAEGGGVRVAGIGEAHDATSFAPLTGDLGHFPNVADAAARAYSAAGIGPDDVDVAEVYGAFGPTELQLYEELGFAEPGKAARAVRDGRTGAGGDVLVNPSGGRLSFGHPPYATPLYEVVEVTRRLREGARRGLVHAEHGVVNGSVVAVLEAD